MKTKRIMSLVFFSVIAIIAIINVQSNVRSERVLSVLALKQKETQVNVPLYEINLEKTAPLSELFESWFAIPLETNDSVLINNIDKIVIKNGYLFLADRKNMTIYQFDKKGHFIQLLERQGPGPEEYIDISDFAVRDSLLYVLSSPNRMINQYYLNGDFIRSYKLNDFYHYFDFLNEDTVVLYSAFSNEQKYNFQLYDMQNNKIVVSHSPFDENQNYVLSKSPFSEDYLESKLVTLPFDYTIYKLDEQFSPIAKFDFNSAEKLPRKKMSFEEYRRELLGKSVVTMFDYITMSLDSTLYTLYNYKFVTHISKTKLQDGQTTTWILQNKDNVEFPFCFAQPLGFYKGYLLSFMPSYAVLQFDENFHSDKNESGKLNADDNPVLFFHKIKFD